MFEEETKKFIEIIKIEHTLVFKENILKRIIDLLIINNDKTILQQALITWEILEYDVNEYRNLIKHFNFKTRDDIDMINMINILKNTENINLIDEKVINNFLLYAIKKGFVYIIKDFIIDNKLNNKRGINFSYFECIVFNTVYLLKSTYSTIKNFHKNINLSFFISRNASLYTIKTIFPDIKNKEYTKSIIKECIHYAIVTRKINVLKYLNSNIFFNELFCNVNTMYKLFYYIKNNELKSYRFVKAVDDYMMTIRCNNNVYFLLFAENLYSKIKHSHINKNDKDIKNKDRIVLQNFSLFIRVNYRYILTYK